MHSDGNKGLKSSTTSWCVTGLVKVNKVRETWIKPICSTDGCYYNERCPLAAPLVASLSYLHVTPQEERRCRSPRNVNHDHSIY